MHIKNLPGMGAPGVPTWGVRGPSCSAALPSAAEFSGGAQQSVPGCATWSTSSADREANSSVWTASMWPGNTPDEHVSARGGQRHDEAALIVGRLEVGR